MEIDRIKVIIVDDHQLVRETWKMILESYNGIEVIAECASGTEAITKATSMNPDIMLMDINMAPVNGFEATRKIVKSNPRIKIIGVSVNNEPGYAKNMMQMGAKGYVTKNSSKEEMIKAIHEVMNGRQYICEEVLSKMNNTK